MAAAVVVAVVGRMSPTERTTVAPPPVAVVVAVAAAGAGAETVVQDVGGFGVGQDQRERIGEVVEEEGDDGTVGSQCFGLASWVSG